MTATFFLLLILFSYALAWLSWVFGQTITPLCLPLANLLAVACTLACRPTTTFSVNFPFRGKLGGGLTIFFCLLTEAVCLFASSLLMDFSWDGNSYHQNTVYALANGWNPIWGFGEEGFIRDNIFSRHYAAGIETVEAVVYSMTARIDSAKAVNLWLVVSTLSFCVSNLRDFVRPVGQRFLLSLLIVANPVVIGQLNTFYIDYAGYLVLICALNLLWKLSKIPSPLTLMVLGATLSFVCVIKANAAIYVYAFTGLAMLLLLRQGSLPRRLVLLPVISAIIGVCVIGWFPYMSNWLSQGHPLYPVYGGDVDIFTDNTPASLSNLSAPLRFPASLCHWLRPNQLPRFFCQSHCDTRTGGLGILFPFTLLLSFWVYAHTSLPRWKSLGWLYLLSILLLAYSFPYSWWARYIPFLYLLPCLVMVVSQIRPCRSKFLARLLVALMVVNSMLFIPLDIGKSISYTMTMNRFLNSFPKGSTPALFPNNVGVVIRLRERGVFPRFVDEEDCTDMYPAAPDVYYIRDKG